MKKATSILSTFSFWNDVTSYSRMHTCGTVFFKGEILSSKSGIGAMTAVTCCDQLKPEDQEILLYCAAYEIFSFEVYH